MASRLFAAAAAASSASASSPLPLARRITSRGVPGPQGRRWYHSEKVNSWEDPRSPMRWKNSHDYCRHFSTEVREPTGKAVSGMRIWWHRATYPIHRIKHRIETSDLQERAMARFVFLVFGMGTPTVIWVKGIWDLYCQELSEDEADDQ